MSDQQATIAHPSSDRFYGRLEVFTEEAQEALCDAAEHDLALPIAIVINALDVSGLNPEQYQRVIDMIETMAHAWRDGFEGGED